ncbi:MAG: succinate dehydrogenase iron-sulfur subunit [Thiovulaceae bacterium]|nr:succinate dehydrogenase iron-sulfur subunit [Sulfurimonadaceae bacterium]
MQIETKNVTFKVFRFNSETDFLPYYETYELEVTAEEVVLDILNRIKWEHSGSLSYRRSCRHGICGSCSIKVNNKAVLACKERMFDMIDLFGTEMTLNPLSEKRAVKDFIIDKADFWSDYDKVSPYLVTDIDEAPTAENFVSPAQAEQILDAEICIQCGNCYYSCPAMETNEAFIGPAAFAKAYRFTADVRDDAKEERLDIINQPGQGVWDCMKCFECAEACPKDVNPIEKITKLHNQVFEEGMALNNVGTRHAVGFKHSIKKIGLLDEAHLVLYSERSHIVKQVPNALKMLKVGKLPMPWSMPKSENLDEIKTLVKSSSTVKF